MNKKKKEERREDSILRNYCYLYRIWIRHNPRNLIYLIMAVAGAVAATYVYVFIPKLAVELVLEQAGLWRLVGTLAAAGLSAELLNLMCTSGYSLMNVPGHRLRHVLQGKILEKICHTAYSDLEDPDYKLMVERSKHLYWHWDRDVRVCIEMSAMFMEHLIGLLLASGILAMLHPAVVAVMLLGAWLQYRAERWDVAWGKKHRDLWQPTERKIDYITGKVMAFSYAKDVRLYAAHRWLLSKYEGFMRERRSWNGKALRHNLKALGASRIVELIKQAAVYGFLVRGVLAGSIGADDFMLYVGLAVQMSNMLSSIAGELRQLKESVLSISDYRKMLERKDSTAREEGQTPVLEPGRTPEVAFSHVSFTYAGAERAALQDIDFTMRPGEKVALVGLNGAGKTTLVKLLCGMYEPTEGEILVDGHPSTKWDLESWYSLFSAVFQDVQVLPATVAENVAACPPEEMDRERVRECLERAGLWETVEKLPKGMDTCLQKEMFRDGVNLSGGETQKLLLARAVYREAPLLILDEPTAALDAIAENQMYLRYSELTKGKTSVFISHRLSSTRFCDRILMLENGRIVEEGSHDQLMAKKGRYYNLFQVQSHYYQNDRNTEFTSEMDPEWEVSGYVSE